MKSLFCHARTHATYCRTVCAIVTLAYLALVTAATAAAQTTLFVPGKASAHLGNPADDAVPDLPPLPPFANSETIPAGTFKHIIIVIQENRTPDNLFGALAAGPCEGPNAFPGSDIANGGSSVKNGKLCNLSQAMNNGSVFDPGHYYHDWYGDYDGGRMDGFCHSYNVQTLQIIYTSCPTTAPSPYSYLQPSDVAPYYSIAKIYGFANYMFQTNEGPSYPAHQFLFTGTSAPVAPDDPSGFSWDFIQDNPHDVDQSGCPNNASGVAAPWIEPNRTTVLTPSIDQCYPHDTLVTGSTCTNGVCDKYPSLSWRYYSPTPSGIIWNAPEAIPEVCYGENDLNFAGQPCGSVNGGTEWKDHMTFYSSLSNAPIFTDISSCNLANVSWVIPDKAWSDHPVEDGTEQALGPSWVASIVNAIGKSYANSGQKCDYWGTNLGSAAEPTAIFIVWDDWGGFYDHVPPYEVLTGWQNGSNWICPAPATNNWGCGNTYGFRVPLLVVSEFTGTKSNGQYSGYISGACGTTGTPNCPNLQTPYIHDFGSILNFTEYNFGLNPIAQPYYADYNALDAVGSNVPLSDFFSLWTGPLSAGRPFVPIGATYSSSFFQTYYATHAKTPTGPDTD